MIGSLYEQGRGVKQSYTDALKWYTAAADQSDSEAQYRIGRLYEQGLGVPQSNTRALEWYHKSAEQGNVEAQEALHNLEK